MNLILENDFYFYFSGNPAATAALPWGHISLFVSSSIISDQSVTKRLAMLAMACLRASGTIRAFAEIKSRDLKVKELYASLGFSTLILGLMQGSEPSLNGAPNSSADSVVPNTDNPAEAGGKGGVALLAEVATPTLATPTTAVTSDTLSAKYSFVTRSF